MSLDQLLAWIPPGSPDETLARQVDFERLPAHVAIIMDGNGRWAAQRHLPRVEGHRAGIDSVRDVVETSARLGIDVLTLYAFSVENWKRPRTEVNTLMTLLKRYLRLELSTLLKNNIRFQVIGRPGGAVARRPARARHRHPPDGRQHRHAVQHRAELRRARRDRRRRAARDCGGRCGRRTRRAAVRRLSLHRRPARSRSPDSHQRRDARQQFPAVADCVLGNLGDRNALAGFPLPASARSHPGLPEARPPLWRHPHAAGRGKLK